MSQSRGKKPHAAGKGGRYRALLGVVGLVALVALGRLAGSHLEAFIAWVDGLGPWGPVVFVAAYVVSAVVLFPSALLSLGAGAVFGVARGVPLVFLGATIGALAAFLVSRYVVRDIVERRISRDRRFSAVDRAVGEKGFRIVLLLRLSPIVPYVLLNYAMGATRVKLRDYLLASIGMLPAVFAYVYYGKLAGEVAGIAGQGAGPSGPGRAVLLGVGLVATVAVTTVIARLARRAVRESTGA